MLICVCGNKIDQPGRAVPEKEGRAWAQSRGYLFAEVSAATGDGVREMFNALFTAVMQRFAPGDTPAAALA
eukprot:EC725754.1.p1 GENE.EC725754.1~~EC725754.1.p1  ORF type:complete len:71 (+),score=14.02 EC725754.1:470-682(+)